MRTSFLSHLSAISAHLESYLELDDTDAALETALLLIDLYEQVLEANEILIIDRGEVRH